MWSRLPFILFALHLVLHISFSFFNIIQPFELFSLMLLGSNGLISIYTYRQNSDRFIAASIMLLIMLHSLIGFKIAPDALTSGAVLVVNILIFYVGYKIFTELPLHYGIIFSISYFLLFFVFITFMENAEALFLASLMCLAATARNYKLLICFFAIVFSFTLAQPYGWESAIFSLLLLNILFSTKSRLNSPTLLLFLGSGIALMFLVLLPIIVTVLQEDPRNIIQILSDAEIVSSLYTTAITATISTLFISLFAIPLAYALSRSTFTGKTLILSLIDTPIIIPHSAAGIALLQVFGRQQYLGQVMYNIFGIQFDGTILGIVLAQIFVSMPFLIKSAYASFNAVPISLELNARTLGAPPFSTFLRIALPLASRGIFMGAILTWARAAGEFGAVLFIAPYPLTAPVAVYNKFTSVGIVQAAPLVSTIILFSIVMFILLQIVMSFIPAHYREESR